MGFGPSNCRTCSRAIRLTELELKPIRTAMTLKLRPLAFSAMMPCGPLLVLKSRRLARSSGVVTR